MTPVMRTLLGVAIFSLATLNGCDRPSSTDEVASPDNICPQKSAQGLCIIGMGIAGTPLVHFEADLAHMQRLSDDSLQISNQLVLVTPKFRWTFTEAKVLFKPAANGKGFDRISGEARIPFDRVPILKEAKTGGGVMAALGYDQGKHLGELGAPLNAETYYLFFAFKENFGVSFGFDDLGIPVRGGEAASKPFTFSPVPEAKLVMALDAHDPFFYVSAKGLSSKKKKKPDDKDDKEKKKPSLNIGGFGYSFQGRIPETVNTPDFNRNMTGNLILEGSVPFPPAPVIQYAGYYLVRQDATLQAIDGDITVGFPLKFLTSFSISLGHATAIAEVKGERAEILMAGQFVPDTTWVPAIIPLFPEEDVQMAVRLDTGNKANNFVHGKGSYALAGSAFAPEGLQFGKVLSKESEFRITPEQIEMSGSVGSDLSPFRFGANTGFDAQVALEKQNIHLNIDGNILIGAFDTNGKLAITPAAVTLTAKLAGPSEWQMALQGKLHKVSQKLMFSGEFDVPDYLNDRIAKSITQTAVQTKQDLNQQITNFTQQLNNLTADLPGVRNAAKKAAELALWNMDTAHDKAIVNTQITSECKGKLIPKCESIAKSVYNKDKQVIQVKAHLQSLIGILNKNDDPSTRAALKTALQTVIDSNPVSIDLTVYKMKVAYLDKDRKQKLQNAINHIDKLRTTGGQKISAQQELEKFTKSTLNRVAQEIKKGANPIQAKSIGFDMPATHSGVIDLNVVLTLKGQAKDKVLSVSFNPKQPQQLPMAIVKQL